MNRASYRIGTPFIGMLVILVLICIFLTLLLPAIHQAREASRCTLCRDNLKRLGVAMHNGPRGFTPRPMNRNRETLRGTTYAKSFSVGLPTWLGKPRYEDEFSERYYLPLETISVSPFRSYHRGICHFLFADESVHSLNEGIDPKLYVGLSSIAGKDSVEVPPDQR